MGDILGKFFIDPKELPDDCFGFIQVLTLGIVYGFILFKSSNTISEGSELLLLVPSLSGLVGSVVLPVLGAVPDGAIVLFSGMGPNAQEQLSVGVGALAGSTIMLLTIPWSLSVIAGRVSLDSNGSAIYKRPKGAPQGWAKLDPQKSSNLWETGVTVQREIAKIGKIMVLTSLIYLVVQIPALQLTGTKAKDSHANVEEVSQFEKTYAYIAFALCCAFFILYLVWNVRRSSQVAKDVVLQKRIRAIRNGEVSLYGVMAKEIESMSKEGGKSSYGTSGLITREQQNRLEEVLKPFFARYDENGDKRMDKHEIRLFFHDLNENPTQEEVDKWFASADQDNSGFIELEELVNATVGYLHERVRNESLGNIIPKNPLRQASPPDEDDEEEEEEEIPNDLADLSFEEQQSIIKQRAFMMMLTGTIAVLLFSDPMVDVLSNIGTRTGIPAFYVSFIIAPLASNASELIASYNYALKKTTKTISISLAALIGAACMNNTFCLGIFMALMAFKAGGLAWEFSAETIAILCVQVIMGYFASKQTQCLGHAVLVLMVYPLSIFLVYALENILGLD